MICLLTPSSLRAKISASSLIEGRDWRSGNTRHRPQSCGFFMPKIQSFVKSDCLEHSQEWPVRVPVRQLHSVRRQLKVMVPAYKFIIQR